MNLFDYKKTRINKQEHVLRLNRNEIEEALTEYCARKGLIFSKHRALTFYNNSILENITGVMINWTESFDEN